MLRMASPGRIMELSKDLTLRVGERGDGRSAGRWTGAAAIIKWDRNAARGSSGTWFGVSPGAARSRSGATQDSREDEKRI